MCRINSGIRGHTKAILPVDAFGQPARLDVIREIADRHGLVVIEDSCCGGRGGMIVTDDDRVGRLCRSMSNQGRGEAGVWLSHERLGYNYRMDELSAALGAAQMSRIEDIIAKRERVAVMRRGAQWTCGPSAWRGCRASTCLVWYPTRLSEARLPYVAPEDTMFAERLAKRPGLTLPCVAVVWRPR